MNSSLLMVYHNVNAAELRLRCLARHESEWETVIGGQNQEPFRPSDKSRVPTLCKVRTIPES